MASSPQLSVIDQRRSKRRSVNLPLIGKHRRLGDVMLHVVNLSRTGFMVHGEVALQPRERITIRLNRIKQIEAFLVWSDSNRAGFQFERVLRDDDFLPLPVPVQGTRRDRAGLHSGCGL